MSIKGLSEATRLPRLGSIRLGIKAVSPKSGKEYPKAVDYFVCPPEVQAIYGEKPKEIDVIFPIDMDIADWQWYKAYSAGNSLICKGDGERATALVDTATGRFVTKDSVATELREVVCNPEVCPLYEKGQCHRLMTLQFIVPTVKALGVWQLNTGSVHSILNVQSSLKLIKGITGRFHMIPMKMSVVPQDVSPEGKRKTVWVLKLVVQQSFDELVLLPALPRANVCLPSVDTTEAPEDFYPEGLIEDEGGETPPQLAERPGPRQRRSQGSSKPPADAPKELTSGAQQPDSEPKEAASAPVEGKEAPKGADSGPADDGDIAPDDLPFDVDQPADGPQEPKAEAPKGYSTRVGSSTSEQQAAVDRLLKDPGTKLSVQAIVLERRKRDASWASLQNTVSMSAYQAAVILEVIAGRSADHIAKAEA